MFPHRFWTRYREVFDQVRVVTRVREVDRPGPWRADGPGVSFVAVPDYVGPWQYLRRARQVRRAVAGGLGPGDAVILRVSSQLAAVLEALLRPAGRPYGVEVIGDPYDVFAPGAVRHPLRGFFRWWFTRQLRRQCAGACAASYVTESALQRRYPASPGAFSCPCSSVDLPEAAFVPAPRQPRPAGGPWTLLFVGTLAQLYKAPDVLIDAVASCRAGGLDVRLAVLGDGRHRAELEARAQSRGLGPHAQFLGQLPTGEAVRARLDQADLFVLPSRQEGLPRALVEAMARGLPCIGSTAGGIPELLPAEDRVPPGDALALARKISEVLNDPERRAKMSARNLATAREYHEEALRPRRVTFYEHVRKGTEEWLRTRTRPA
jgi:glycosyltransferase involved in cell wall biosynthesis